VAYFVAGAIAMGYVVAALYFLRFRRETRDRLFGFFAIAFALLAVQRTLHPLLARSSDLETWLYVLRASAFILIAVAIVDRNRRD
jgi:hypothetical protein